MRCFDEVNFILPRSFVFTMRRSSATAELVWRWKNNVWWQLCEKQPLVKSCWMNSDGLKIVVFSQVLRRLVTLSGVRFDACLPQHVCSHTTGHGELTRRDCTVHYQRPDSRPSPLFPLRKSQHCWAEQRPAVCPGRAWLNAGVCDSVTPWCKRVNGLLHLQQPSVSSVSLLVPAWSSSDSSVMWHTDVDWQGFTLLNLCHNDPKTSSVILHPNAQTRISKDPYTVPHSPI